MLEKGKLAEAVAESREAVRLLKDNPQRRSSCEAEQMARLDARLPAVLEGKDRPKDADESLAFAHLCLPPYREQYAAAARFFGEAFADPKLADDLQSGDRYNAACSAALAAAGRGKDADKFDDKERAASAPPGAGLAAGRPAGVGPRGGQGAGRRPRRRRDFAALGRGHRLRGGGAAEALGKLPEAERQPWQKLWADVADLLARARGKTAPEKKPNEK